MMIFDLATTRLEPQEVASGLAISLLVVTSLFFVTRGKQTLKCYRSSWWCVNEHQEETIECCPRRRARFMKCAKRRQGRRQISDSWACPFECRFARIHLPAPLPFRRRRRRRTHVKFRESETDETGNVSVLPSEPSDKIKDVERMPSLGSTTSTESSSSSQDTFSEGSKTSTSDSTDQSPQAKRTHRRHKRHPSDLLLSYPPLPVSASSLIDLAMMQNWPQLLVNLRANHRGAKQRDADGLYPLHWAVSGAPPMDIVRALLNAYPGAIKKHDSEGSNALHFASHYGGSAEMIKLLVDTYSKAATKLDKYGRSPLYHAVDKSASKDVLTTLVTAEPSMVTVACKPRNHQTLQEHGRAWNFQMSPLYLAWVNVLTDKRTVETSSGKILDKALYLLGVAFCHRYGLAHDEASTVPLMVALVALDDVLPSELLGHLISKATSPDVFLQVDPVSGKNPLLLAASLRHVSEERSTELVEILVDACPGAAAEVDRDGKTALANAALSGKNWNLVRRLVFATPEALGHADESTGLVPPLLAATAYPSAMQTGQGASKSVVSDPYGLLGKPLAASLSTLNSEAQSEQQKPSPSRIDSEMAHLTTLYLLLQEDPACIFTANKRCMNMHMSVPPFRTKQITE